LLLNGDEHTFSTGFSTNLNANGTPLKPDYNSSIFIARTNHSPAANNRVEISMSPSRQFLRSICTVAYGFYE